MRYYRKSRWSPSQTEGVAYVGDVEIITRAVNPYLVEKIFKTRLSDNVMHVRVEGEEILPPPDLGTVPRTEEFFEYAHRRRCARARSRVFVRPAADSDLFR